MQEIITITTNRYQICVYHMVGNPKWTQTLSFTYVNVKKLYPNTTNIRGSIKKQSTFITIK